MKIDVLGVQVNTDTKNTIIFLIKKLLSEGQKIFIVTPYSEMIVRAQKDEEFRNILNSAQFALPDGAGILWAASFLKHKTHNMKQVSGFRFQVLWELFKSLTAIIFYPKYIRTVIPEKISGSDFIWDIARIAEDRGYSIFLLGGFDDTPDMAAKKLQEKFPNLRIAGILSPPREGELEGVAEQGQTITSPNPGVPQNSTQFWGGSLSSRGGGGIIEQINSSGADFLFVALGPIKQEKWIVQHLERLNIRLAVGLGGTFDYLAGRRLLAPQIWRNLGLEWLWRLLTQPWRLWRISKGVLGLIWHTLKKMKPPSGKEAANRIWE